MGTSKPSQAWAWASQVAGALGATFGLQLESAERGSRVEERIEPLADQESRGLNRNLYHLEVPLAESWK